MSLSDKLAAARLKYAFNSISISKASYVGNFKPVEVEILDSHLTSQTDELDIISDKDRPLPQKELKSALHSRESSKPVKHVTFSSISDDKVPSSSTSVFETSFNSPLKPFHKQQSCYSPISQYHSLNHRQKQTVLGVNLRHLGSSLGLYVTPDSSTLPPMDIPARLPETKDIVSQDIVGENMQLMYPDDSELDSESVGCTVPANMEAPAIPAEVVSAEPEHRTSQPPQPPAARDDEPDAEERESRLLEGAEEAWPKDINMEGSCLEPLKGFAEWESDQELAEKRQHLAEQSSLSQPPLLDPCDGTDSCRNSRKTPKGPPSPQSSLFVPKRQRPPVSPTGDARPRSGFCHAQPVNGITKFTKNRVTSARRDIHRSPFTPLRDPFPQRSRPRFRQVENYRIQEDRNAKHPEQRMAQLGLVDKQADRLIRGISELLAILRKPRGQVGPVYRQALEKATSALDDFGRGKRMIKLDFLRARPMLLRTVAEFAHSDEGDDDWPTAVRMLKEEAKEINLVWMERFNCAGLKNH